MNSSGVGILIGLLAVATPVSGQQTPAADSSKAGSYHITAIRTDQAISIDGTIDEEVWQRAEIHTGFTQAEPEEGAPSTERTEVRVVYSEQALYVAAVCYDEDPDRIVVTDIKKDFATENSDVFAFVIDGFLDKKNGFIFITNPYGARFDQQVANEGRDLNPDWDGVWSVSTRITDEGWIAEFEVPFKTLRFSTGAEPRWGINFARRIRRRNELAFWYPVPRRWNLYRTAFAGTVGGLETVRQGRNLKIKPFGLASSARSLSETSYVGDLSAGLDLKYGVTSGLTLDVTLNTDFSQVESDVQQVNLTRFSLFFPEKREFFLENAGIFQFGEVPRNTRGTSAFRPPEEEILLFFSRRIGLSEGGELIPLSGGARLTGRAGATTVGVLNLQAQRTTVGDGDTTAQIPATNFLVSRVKRDVLANSDVGAIFINKEATDAPDVFNRVVGADGNFRFLEVWTVNGFVAKSFSPSDGSVRDELAGKLSAGYNSNVYQASYSYLDIGDDFTDEVGFLKRVGIRKQFVDIGARPRPTIWPRFNSVVRELHPHFRVSYFTDQNNELVTREGHYGFSFNFQDGAATELSWNPVFERLTEPFAIRPDIAIPPGDYQFGNLALRVDSDASRAVAGALRLEWGDFWNGRRTVLRGNVALRPSYRLAVELNLEHNDVTLPNGSFTANLVGLRSAYSFTTNMFLNALVQYNTDLDLLSSNIRFNVIHHPLSDLFVVYNEERPTVESPVLTGRSVTVKFTQLLSF